MCARTCWDFRDIWRTIRITDPCITDTCIIDHGHMHHGHICVGNTALMDTYMVDTTIRIMDPCITDTCIMDTFAWVTRSAPEGREGRCQAGPKGSKNRKLEVRLWRGPRLLVSIYLLYWHWSGVFRLWANEAFHRILIGDGRPWARNEHQWHFGEKCNYKFLNTTNRPRFCTKLIQSNLIVKQSRSNLVEMLDKSETVRSLSVDCPTILYFFARSLLLPLSHMPHCCYHWKWIFGWYNTRF